MQSLQSIGSVSWFSHYWSRNDFVDLLNCETLVDGDTKQPTEIAFWKIWDAPVIKGRTWSGHLFNCCVGGYMYIWNLCKTVALQIGLLETSKGSEVEMMKFQDALETASVRYYGSKIPVDELHKS